MHNLNEEDSRQGARRCGRQERLVERTAFPVFDGDQENWFDFSRLFKEIIKITNQAPMGELAHLRRKLPDTARRLLTVLQEPAKAWKLLSKIQWDNFF